MQSAPYASCYGIDAGNLRARRREKFGLRSIEHVLIYIKDCDNLAYVDFLGSYGAQLRCATFWGMSKDACQQVMAHCPNIRASFYLHTTNNLDYQHAVPVLAPALTELLHVNAEEPLRRYDLENATRACATQAILLELLGVAGRWQIDTRLLISCNACL